MSKAQSIIEKFYQEEQSRLADEATFNSLDVTISSADMAMISIIAKRFSKDKSLLAREALRQALQAMFRALDPVERKMLAKDADELGVSIAAEIAEEQGLEKLDVSGVNWVLQDKNCVKEEKKADKERAKQQEENAQNILTDEPQATDSQPVESQEFQTEVPPASEPTETEENADVNSEEEVVNNNSIFA